jgi:hypothetical protein
VELAHLLKVAFNVAVKKAKTRVSPFAPKVSPQMPIVLERIEHPIRMLTVLSDDHQLSAGLQAPDGDSTPFA